MEVLRAIWTVALVVVLHSLHIHASGVTQNRPMRDV